MEERIKVHVCECVCESVFHYEKSHGVDGYTPHKSQNSCFIIIQGDIGTGFIVWFIPRDRFE